MEEGRSLRYKLGYEKMLRAVGKFCDEHKLEEVCLLEFEKGVVLQALQIDSTSDGYIRRLVSETWSYQQLAEMAK